MGLDGVLGDVEHLRDVGVRPPQRELVQHVALWAVRSTTSLASVGVGRGPRRLGAVGRSRRWIAGWGTGSTITVGTRSTSVGPVWPGSRLGASSNASSSATAAGCSSSLVASSVSSSRICGLVVTPLTKSRWCGVIVVSRSRTCACAGPRWPSRARIQARNAEAAIGRSRVGCQRVVRRGHPEQQGHRAIGVAADVQGDGARDVGLAVQVERLELGDLLVDAVQVTGRERAPRAQRRRVASR